ncbi:hypothetical protein Tco_0105669 [Tanacetum coccineum]
MNMVMNEKQSSGLLQRDMYEERWMSNCFSGGIKNGDLQKMSLCQLEGFEDQDNPNSRFSLKEGSLWAKLAPRACCGSCGGCQDSRRSTWEVARFLRIDWLAGHQRAKSYGHLTTEVEYFAIAITLVATMSSTRIKQHRLRHHFIREQVENGVVELLHGNQNYTTGRYTRKRLYQEMSFDFLLPTTWDEEFNHWKPYKRLQEGEFGLIVTGLGETKKIGNHIIELSLASADVPSSVTETTDTTSTLPPPPPPLQKPTDKGVKKDPPYHLGEKRVLFTYAVESQLKLDIERRHQWVPVAMHTFPAIEFLLKENLSLFVTETKMQSTVSLLSKSVLKRWQINLNGVGDGETQFQ